MLGYYHIAHYIIAIMKTAKSTYLNLLSISTHFKIIELVRTANFRQPSSSDIPSDVAIFVDHKPS
jgi:hypothetical protein